MQKIVNCNLEARYVPGTVKTNSFNMIKHICKGKLWDIQTVRRPVEETQRGFLLNVCPSRHSQLSLATLKYNM